MGRRPGGSGRNFALLVLGVVGLTLLSGCGGHANPLSGPDATPAARTATATTVDVCDLVPASTASQLLDRAMVVVGRSVSPSRSATVECDIGERFGEPLVVVTLAPDPIAQDVFDAAFGDRVGGNPTRVQLGDAAYLRTEDVHRVIHVFVHGAVVSVSTVLGPLGSPDAISKVQLTRLTRTAVKALPENPVVESSTAPRPCDEVDGTVLANTLGRPPSLDAGLEYSSGSLICAWSGQPGSVTVEMTADPAEISRFLDQNPLDQEVAVAGIVQPSQGRAYSSPLTAGDLVLLVRNKLMTIAVVPAAGYADESIDTSDSERAVAKAGLQLLAGLS